MVEYYGWISISDSTYESDDNEMNSILENINSFILTNEMNESLGVIKIHKVNGLSQLLLSGCRNRLSQEVIDIFELYKYIASIAKGSYGLLYLKNDESDDAFNEFEVFVLARGKIRKEKDPFLSPCIPTIEDGE
ncbi:Imm7 family immunity protein [Orbus wheelerorum]|uniref:Imm7 family immunity protein n=1 Tax=Orbus wheelerorum TaxID=3074111 RepID=UPI00370D12E1